MAVAARAIIWTDCTQRTVDGYQTDKQQYNHSVRKYFVKINTSNISCTNEIINECT
jgi:hypothetical protein